MTLQSTRTRTRRALVGAGAALAAAALAVGAGAGLDRSNQRGVVKVAVIEVVKGHFAPQNRLVANGAEIAVQQINAKGGIGGKVEIDLTRHRIAPSASPVATVLRLSRQGVRTLILPCNVDLQPQIADEAARHGMFMIAPCDFDAHAKRARYWPVGMAGNAQAGQLAGMAKRNNGTSAFVLESRATYYGRKLTSYFRAAMRLYGIRLAGQTAVEPRKTSITSLAEQIKRAQPRIIFTALQSPDAQVVVAGLRRQGVLTPVYGTDAADGGFNLSNYGESDLADFSFASHGFPRPTSDAFFEDYRKAFKTTPVGSFPGLGFESVRVLEAAVRKARSTAPAALDAQLKKKGLTVVGVALGDMRYPGRGARRPLANVGVAAIIFGEYTPLFASVPVPVPRP